MGLYDAIAGAVSGIANIFSSDGPFGYSSEHKSKVLADYQTALNMQMADYQNEINLSNWNLQNAYNSPSNQVALMRAAGLNPALVNGQPTAATPLQSAQMQAGDVATSQNAVSNSKLAHIQAISAIAQISNLIAQTAKLKADTKSVEISNQREQSFDSTVSRQSYRYYDPDTGQDIADLKVWQAAHPRQIPEVEVLSGYANKGQLDAIVALSQSNSLVHQADSDAAAADFRKKVVDLQSDNPKVSQALSEMPVQDYKKILVDISKVLQDTRLSKTQEGLVLSQQALNEFELQARKDTSLAGMLDAIKDPTLSPVEKITSVIGVALSVIVSRLSSGH